MTSSPPVVQVNGTTAATTGPRGIASVLGECSIKLSHSTTYEPPLYLFPELLPRVPQGTPPMLTWDAVADAVDVNASFWRILDLSYLSGGQRRERSGEAQSDHPQSGSHPTAMHTLASLIAANRLTATGLSADVLRDGRFSSASILDELATLVSRAKLGEDEGKVLMTNHFINLLAWKKLREINHSAPTTDADEPIGVETLPSKRPRHETIGVASPDPWSCETDFEGHCGVFISSRETNVEDQVTALRLLTHLYKAPVRRLESRGQQTDYVVPPGTVNITTPYADTRQLPGASLNLAHDLGWTRDKLSLPSVPYLSLVITSVGDGTTVGEVCQCVPLTTLCTNVGRVSGVCRSLSGPIYIHIGVGQVAQHPMSVAEHHCSFVLRQVKVSESVMDISVDGTGSRASSTGDTLDENGDAASTIVHKKTPRQYALWLLNYGSNGVRIMGKRWVLGEAARLDVGDVVQIVGDVCITVQEGGPDAVDAPMLKTEASVTPQQAVKLENDDDG